METTLDLGAVLEQEPFTMEGYEKVKELGFVKRESLHRLQAILAELERKVNAGEGGRSAQAVKLGMCYLLLSKPEEAARWLGQAEAGAQRSYFLGLAYRELKRAAESVQEFEAAAGQGWDRAQCDCQRAESLLAMGEVDKAREVLEGLSAAGLQTPDWYYVRGRIAEQLGEVDGAIEQYEKAVELNPEHAQAMFHLAFLLDLHGADQRALELYEACADLPFAHIHAMMNLAVIYEDRGDYEGARDCLRRVLEVEPNNRRALLYMKDVLATGDMYIDEQQVKEEEARDAVLDIPVTDFELSVRSRNCLKKMNIHTLGDLLRTTEEDLLGYKNFGETSLREIKAMLAQKGLSLGRYTNLQRAEPAPPAPETPLAAAPEVLARPASSLQLSVRSRKCLQMLGVATLGDLISKTESELLNSRNFGQTSLNEIKGRLTEMGLSLKIAK